MKSGYEHYRCPEVSSSMTDEIHANIDNLINLDLIKKLVTSFGVDIPSNLVLLQTF